MGGVAPVVVLAVEGLSGWEVEEEVVVILVRCCGKNRPGRNSSTSSPHSFSSRFMLTLCIITMNGTVGYVFPVVGSVMLIFGSPARTGETG